MCSRSVLKNPTWTVGCAVDVRLQHHRASNKRFFLEFWDVGGSRKYKVSRTMFYSSINGIVLVFDLNNIKSYRNLRQWIKEISHVARTRGIEEKYVYHDAKHGDGAGGHGSSLGSIPVIIIGNKRDLEKGKKGRRTYNSVKDLGFEMVRLCGTGKFNKDDKDALNKFFRRVIERRYYRAHTDKHSRNVIRRGNATPETPFLQGEPPSFPLI